MYNPEKRLSLIKERISSGLPLSEYDYCIYIMQLEHLASIGFITELEYQFYVSDLGIARQRTLASMNI